MEEPMSMQEIKEKIHQRKLYYCTNQELIAEQAVCLELLYDFNATRPSQGAKREELLKKMFAEIGSDCYIEPPLHSNWGGKNVHFGHDVYANFNLTLVDDTDIYIGDYVLIGPNVTLSAGTHPVHPCIRKKQAQFNVPIRIGSNVWIGAGSIVLPGVEIGENTVIGAGSVVTKNIPANVVAMGAPCRVVREINDRDYRYYYKELQIDIE